MKAIRTVRALAITGLAAGWILGGAMGGAGTAAAQETQRWSDIDCAQSKLVVPPGLNCRTTQNFAGGDSSTGTAGGTFKSSLADGRMNGASVLYYLTESTSLGASVMENASLKSAIRSAMKDGNMIHEFSAMGNRGGADYMTFMTGAGNSCVSMRRTGPPHNDGYKWILFGVSCDPRGATLTDAQIDGFIAGASYRGS